MQHSNKSVQFYLKSEKINPPKKYNNTSTKCVNNLTFKAVLKSQLLFSIFSRVQQIIKKILTKIIVI